MCERLPYVDLGLVQAVAKMVGGPIPTEDVKPNHGKKSGPLSQAFFMPKTPTMKSRRIAIIIADGYEKSFVVDAKAAIMAAGAVPWIIGPRRNYIYAAGEEHVKGNSIFRDHHFEDKRSTMFDALLIPPGAECTLTLRRNGRAIHWVREAFGHLETIGTVGEVVTFLQASVQFPGVTLAINEADSKVVTSYGVVTAAKYQADSILAKMAMAKDAVDFISAFGYEAIKHRCWEREMDGLNSQVAY